jgi:acetyl esterase/lipase
VVVMMTRATAMLAMPMACGLLWLQPAAAAGSEPPVVFLYAAEADAPMVAEGGAETVRVTEQGEHVVSNVHRPSLGVYLPEKGRASGTAVIVVPGGGYRELWLDHEGGNVARFLNERGIAAFVIKYRLPRAPNSRYSVLGDSLGDLLRAVRVVRSRAAEWSLDPRRIGVLGFSAGGNLAGLGVMNSDPGIADAALAIDRTSSRPDFAALIYPGTFDELRLEADDPPLFLLCGSDDRPEVVAGITRMYLAARELKIPAELHLYDRVGHGFGLRAGNTGPVTAWPRQFVDWLAVEKMLPAK